MQHVSLVAIAGVAMAAALVACGPAQQVGARPSLPAEPSADRVTAEPATTPALRTDPPPTPVPPTPTPTLGPTISGRVVEIGTGAAVPGMNVQVWPYPFCETGGAGTGGPAAFGKSAGDGSFTLTWTRDAGRLTGTYIVVTSGSTTHMFTFYKNSTEANQVCGAAAQLKVPPSVEIVIPARRK